MAVTENWYYNATSILAEFFKDTYSTKTGNYSASGSGSTQGFEASQQETEEGVTPAGVYPGVSKTSLIQRDGQSYTVNGYPQRQEENTFTSTFFAIVIDTKKESYLYGYSFIKDTSSLDLETKREIKNYFSVGQSSQEIPFDPIAFPFSSLQCKLGLSLKADTLFFVPPASGSGSYNTGFWTGKKIEDYKDKPNIYTNTEPTESLSNVPVWTAQINQQTGSIELRNDIIVKKVFPLLDGAVVLAASYYE